MDESDVEAAGERVGVEFEDMDEVSALDLGSLPPLHLIQCILKYLAALQEIYF